MANVLRGWWVGGLLAVLVLVMHVPTIGVPPLAGTEGHRVVTAHTMNVTGNYLVPHMYGRVYLAKPPMYYWILAGAEWVGGANTWAWRIPSAVAAALTALVCWAAARRWFGEPAGVVAGLAYVTMVALWQESRSADIDPFNVLAATVASLALLELVLRRATVGVVAIAWAAVAAGFLLKGPGMLYAVLGVMLGPAVAMRDWRLAVRPAAWGAVVAGAVPFVVWTMMVKGWLAAHPEAYYDKAGVNEALSKMVVHGVRELMESAQAGLLLLVIGLPATVGLAGVFRPAVRGERMARGLAAGFAAGVVLFVLSGRDNERYAYVLFPMLAPLAGVVATRIELRLAGAWAMGTGAALAGAAVVLAGLIAWKYPPLTPATIAPVACAVPLAVWVGLLLVRGRMAGAGVGIVGLAVLACVMLGRYSDARRDGRSALGPAREVAARLPAGVGVTTGRMVNFQPEFFWYLDRPVQWLGDMKQWPAAPASGERWLVLMEKELAAYRAANPGRVLEVYGFVSNKDRCALVLDRPGP